MQEKGLSLPIHQIDFELNMGLKLNKGLVYALIAATLWAIVTPVIKKGMAYGFSDHIISFAGIRFAISGFILTAVLYNKQMWATIKAHSKLLGLLSVFNVFVGYVAFYYGIHFAGGAVTSIIMGTSPLINVFLAHMIAKNDRLNPYKIVSMVVALTGILLIIAMGKDGAPMDLKVILGIGLVLSSVIIQGVCVIKVKEYNREINPVFMNAIQMLFGGILLYVVGVTTEGYQTVIGLPFGFYICMILLFIVSIFGFSLWFKALQQPGAKVSDINMCRLIDPILGAFISWTILQNESPNPYTILGIVIVVSSLIIYFKGETILNKIRGVKS